MSLDPASWLAQAQALPEGGRERTTHNCGPGKVLTVDHKKHGWGAWCHRCNDDGWVHRPRESLTQRLARLQAMRATEEALERDVTPPSPAILNPREWPIAARVWLYKAGLSNARIESLGFYYHEHSKRVVLLVREHGRTVYWQARGFDPERPKYLNPASGKSVFTCGEPDARVVITEDILSAVRVGDSGVAQGWCIMGTSLPDKVLLRLVRAGKPVDVWLDPDAAGDKGARKFLPKLRAAGLTTRILRSAKDPKLHSTEEIRHIIGLDAASAA